IVGLTMAWELRRRQKDSAILILEKEPDPGLHASGRNSGVLHAGIYYKPGSLKAKLCADGARRMREFCEAQSLPFEKTGKVILPQEPRLLPMIHELKRRADAAGVRTEVIDVKTLLDIEPAANPAVEMALHSPDTATV